MNSRLSALLWMLVVAVAAFGLYMVKYKVQGLQMEIARTQKKLDEERESLNVAAAEWAYLTQPQRLQRLSEKYLAMKPAKSSQLAGLDALDRLGSNIPPQGMVLSASAKLPLENE